MERFLFLVSARAGLASRAQTASIVQSMQIDSHAEFAAKGAMINTMANALPGHNQNLLMAANEQTWNAIMANRRAQNTAGIGMTASRLSEIALNEINTFPSSLDYYVDLFAMRTGEFFDGHPVYEVGRFLDP